MLSFHLMAMCSVLLWATAASAGESFDRSHVIWSALLAAHVRWNDAGTATTVDYAGFARDRAALDAYRAALATVSERDLAQWPAPDQLEADLRIAGQQLGRPQNDVDTVRGQITAVEVDDERPRPSLDR